MYVISCNYSSAYLLWMQCVISVVRLHLFFLLPRTPPPPPPPPLPSSTPPPPTQLTMPKLHDETDQELYCICRQTADAHEYMVMCDGCDQWFHGPW